MPQTDETQGFQGVQLARSKSAGFFFSCAQQKTGDNGLGTHRMAEGCAYFLSGTDVTDPRAAVPLECSCRPHRSCSCCTQSQCAQSAKTWQPAEITRPLSKGAYDMPAARSITCFCCTAICRSSWSRHAVSCASVRLLWCSATPSTSTVADALQGKRGVGARSWGTAWGCRRI